MGKGLSAAEVAEIRERHENIRVSGWAGTPRHIRMTLACNDIPSLCDEVDRLRAENEALRDALDLERKGDPLSAEVEGLREALKWMRFAYINKDADMPHQFEIEALQEAEKLIGPCAENGGTNEKG